MMLLLLVARCGLVVLLPTAVGLVQLYLIWPFAMIALIQIFIEIMTGTSMTQVEAGHATVDVLMPWIQKGIIQSQQKFVVTYCMFIGFPHMIIKHFASTCRKKCYGSDISLCFHLSHYCNESSQ